MPEARRVQRFALVVLFPESAGKHGDEPDLSMTGYTMLSSAHWEQDGGQRPTLRAIGAILRINP